MTMTATHFPAEIVQLALRAQRPQFEEWTKSVTPAFSLGAITINGQFDRYFKPDTQGAWEGWQRAMNVAASLRMAEIRHRNATLYSCIK